MLGPGWNGAPRGARALVVVLVVVFLYGTAVHVLQLAGVVPSPDVPAPLRAYFVALTVLDPLAAGLLAGARRSGVVLAPAVLVTDAAANAYADYALAGSGVTARAGQAVVTLLAVISLIGTPALWRHASPG